MINKTGLSSAGLAAFVVGLFSPFTVPLVGEMPVGEIVLLLVLGWMALYVALEHRLPARVLSNPLLCWMLVCEGIALCGYVMADMAWHSTVRDEVRGWARMVFLGIDLLTLAYLFAEGGRPALVSLMWGGVVGGMIQPLIFRPLFGDYWKFGFGTPLSVAVLLLVPMVGCWPGVLLTLGLSGLHFALNFRSAGGLFLLLSVLLVMQRMPVRLRLACIPVGALLAAGALGFIAHRSATANRSHDLRSNISRAAMLKAAWHGIEAHPFIGNGSWLGRSGVIDDYLEIRYATAQEEHLGGIGHEGVSADEEQSYAIHSQILVALAEGGVLGGAFFIFYGVLLLLAVAYYAGFRSWSPYSALYLYLLLSALFNLCMSPFSGVHRVYIATASGLLLLIWNEYAGQRAGRLPSSLAPKWKVPPRMDGASYP